MGSGAGLGDNDSQYIVMHWGASVPMSQLQMDLRCLILCLISACMASPELTLLSMQLKTVIMVSLSI